MPFIPCPKVVQVEMIFQWSSQTVETVWHYSTFTGPQLADMAALADFCRLAWSNSLRALSAPTLSLNNIKCTDLSTQTGFVFQTSSGLPLAGTSASPSMPNNVAIVGTKRTALRGRSYRGRFYVPGLTEATVTDNTVSAPFVTAVLGWGNGMLSTTINGNLYTLGVLSRYNGGVARTQGVITDVTGFTCDGIIDSQRRRLPGRGK